VELRSYIQDVMTAKQKIRPSKYITFKDPGVSDSKIYRSYNNEGLYTYIDKVNIKLPLCFK